MFNYLFGAATVAVIWFCVYHWPTVKQWAADARAWFKKPPTPPPPAAA